MTENPGEVALVDEARPVIWVRGEFEWFVSPDECDDDQQAAMDLVRERIGEAGGRVLTRAESAHWPPANLPATLATVDDVAAVCQAAGLTEYRRHTWTDQVVDVLPSLATPGSCVWRSCKDGWTGRVDHGTPSVLLWHAIQAARSAR